MLSKEQENIIIETLKPFNPVYIGLFGSYARNEETEKSDIDILYDLREKLSLFDLMDLKENLKRKLNKEVDLVSKRFLNRHIKPFVERDVKILFGAA